VRLRNEVAIRGGAQRVDYVGVNRPSPARRVDVRISENVRDGVRHFRWRAQRVCVVPIREHLSMPTERAVHCAGDANRERLYSTCERHRIACLDNEVNMVALNREVHQPKSIPLASRPDRVKNQSAARSAA
jgi:hypothetical protein